MFALLSFTCFSLVSGAFNLDARTSLELSFDLGAVASLYHYWSWEGEAQGNGQGTGSASVDGFHSVSYAGWGKVPTNYVTYFSADANWSVNSSQTGESGATAIAQADVTAAGAFVGSAFVGLKEMTPADETVSTFTFEKLKWTMVKADKVNGKSKVTFTGVHYLPGFSGDLKVELEFENVESSQRIGDVTMTPLSTESTVKISGFELSDQANSMELVILAASGSGQLGASASAEGAWQHSGKFNRITAGSGTSATYVDFKTECDITGGGTASVDVKFDATAATDADLTTYSGDFATQLSAKVGGSANAEANLRRVLVRFPAGKTSVTYDPGMGVGEAPDHSPASHNVPQTLFLSLICAVLLFSVSY